MDNVTKLEVRMAETTNGDGMAAASLLPSTRTDGESGGGNGDHAVNGGISGGQGGSNINGQDSLALDASTLVQLQAAAFRSLCRHLEERSDLVSNMDLMSASGFCRNCLAKWMVLEARRMVDENVAVNNSSSNSDTSAATAILNAFGYNEAAQLVYGMSVDSWKERHQKKATSEQLERYQASTALHAAHDADYLAVRSKAVVDAKNGTTTLVTESTTPATATSTTDTPPVAAAAISAPSLQAVVPPNLASNVCCQDMDDDDDGDVATVTSSMPSPYQGGGRPVLSSTTTAAGSLIATGNVVNLNPPLTAPATDVANTTTTTTIPLVGIDLSMLPNQQFPVTAIMTVSDRAYAGMYETGDLSGPAVIAAIQSLTGLYDLDFVTVTVPDDSAAIQAKLNILANQGVDLILTTGGTGLSPRDVTPEATVEAVEHELTSLMPWVSTTVGALQQQAWIKQQQQEQESHSTAATTTTTALKPWPGPTTTLSRGTAGIIQSTVVANLPGNPRAVTEIMPILLPLLLQAVAELHLVTPEILHIG